MTFPAEISARADRSLSPIDRSVYGYLTTILDCHDVRPVSSEYHCLRAGVSRRTFDKARDRLIDLGYLYNHAPGLRNVHRLTLMNSLRARAG